MRTKLLRLVEEELQADEQAGGRPSLPSPVVDFLSRMNVSTTEELRQVVLAAQNPVVAGEGQLFGSATNERATSLRRGSYRRNWSELYVFHAKTLKFVHGSDGALRNTAYSQLELSKLTPLDLKPLFSRIQFEEMVEPLRCDQRSSIQFKTYHLRRDGSVYQVEIELQLVKDPTYPIFVARGSTSEFLALQRFIHPLNGSKV